MKTMMRKFSGRIKVSLISLFSSWRKPSAIISMRLCQFYAQFYAYKNMLLDYFVTLKKGLVRDCISMNKMHTELTEYIYNLSLRILRDRFLMQLCRCYKLCTCFIFYFAISYQRCAHWSKSIVLTLDGSSEHGAHIRNKSGNSICERHQKLH